MSGSQLREAIIGASPEERASCSISRVVTTNDLRDVCPNGADRNIGSITTPGDQDTADPRNVVTRVERVPAPADECLEPGAEIHRSGVRRHADISQITGAISSGDVHAPAKRHSEVSEVAAHAPLLGKTLRGAPGRIGVLISEPDVRVNEIADRLHPSPAGRSAA